MNTSKEITRVSGNTSEMLFALMEIAGLLKSTPEFVDLGVSLRQLLPEFFRVKCERVATLGTSQIRVSFENTELCRQFIAALRTRNRDLSIVKQFTEPICHNAGNRTISSELERTH
jgi:hypothetical protein